MQVLAFSVWDETVKEIRSLVLSHVRFTYRSPTTLCRFLLGLPDGVFSRDRVPSASPSRATLTACGSTPSEAALCFCLITDECTRLAPSAGGVSALCREMEASSSPLGAILNSLQTAARRQRRRGSLGTTRSGILILFTESGLDVCCLSLEAV